MLELVNLETRVFSISCHFKNCEDGFIWTFTGFYGPTLKRGREWFWGELGVIKGLWSGPWCVAGDFNLIKCPEERNKGRSLNSDMRRFFEVTEDLELKDTLLGGSFYLEWRGEQCQGWIVF